MIEYTTARTDDDLQQILALQKQNLVGGLTKEQINAQGFVTVSHRFEDLKKMNEIEQHVICKDNGRVVAYLLAMTAHSRFDVPILVPLFEMFERVKYRERKIADYKYVVVGQACVAEGYRGKGIVDACYTAYRNCFKNKYEFAVTEIATRNQRSVKAHKRVGFESIYEYAGPDGEEWSVVVWRW
ncbi:MAG TPA: GNAT family N-acetyltransferase [Niastella sp.]|nr:GNAT family N-acetyltransferase [Niastella sp.]